MLLLYDGVKVTVWFSPRVILDISIVRLAVGRGRTVIVIVLEKTMIFSLLVIFNLYALVTLVTLVTLGVIV